MNPQITQPVFSSLRELGALVTTPEISVAVKDKANNTMEKLLSILEKEVQQLSAKSNGIIT